MSTSIDDIIESEMSSNCCGSSMYEMGNSYICLRCKEHCDAVTEES